MKAKELVAKYGNDPETICSSILDELSTFSDKGPDKGYVARWVSKIKELRLKWKAVANQINADPNFFDTFIKQKGCEELLQIEKDCTPISKRY